MVRFGGIDNDYFVKVVNALTNNPTGASLDFLVEAHAAIGYYAGVAESIANEAEVARKVEEANVILDGRKADPKASFAILEAQAISATEELRYDEAKAKANARKISNLLESVEQTINAIKFIGRETNVRIG